jgi:hypothetical protein
MTRFTITCPLVDNSGTERTDFPQHLEKLLRASGIEGWTALPGSGVWHHFTEPVTVYVIDGPAPLFATLEAVAEDFALYAGQDAVYLTREPIETFIVRAPEQQPGLVFPLRAGALISSSESRTDGWSEPGEEA